VTLASLVLPLAFQKHRWSAPWRVGASTITFRRASLTSQITPSFHTEMEHLSLQRELSCKFLKGLHIEKTSSACLPTWCARKLTRLGQRTLYRDSTERLARNGDGIDLPN
jgi:hypothetical protein